MRIIDKNTDFYDYMQDPTDTLVFDRRGSWLLDKEKVNGILTTYRHRIDKSKIRFALLQCGATFWLFLIKVTEMNKTYGTVRNYEMEELTSWKDYDKQLELIKLDFFDFNMSYKLGIMKDNEYDAELCKKNLDKMLNAINYKEIEVYGNVNCKDGVPLLKATGIGNIVDNTKIFCAIEEYFSLKKTESETTEPKGATNDDKIIMHGFDTKTSFRGKN